MADLRVTFPRPCDERWERMTRAGCHRICAKCDKTIHDLSQYEVDEVERLLRDEPDSCVRARIDASGVISTKPDRHGNMRRMVAVFGASAGLLMSPPVLARDQQKNGAIAGTAQPLGMKTIVIAKDANGKTYRARIKSGGRYKIRNVPPGIYAVEFSEPGCGSWTVENVGVGSGAVSLVDEPVNDQYCITVGLLKAVDGNG